jgi:5-methylcytosine-specific restriction endonuclease McrA
MRTRWAADEWHEATLTLLLRAGHLCEACGVRLVNGDEVARHHRQRRAVGGDRLSNVVVLHGECHRSVHSHPELARRTGLIVSSYVTEPETVPLQQWGRRWVRLDDLGGVLLCAAPDAG